MTTTPQELVEKLAAAEHERWADWQRYLHSRCINTVADRSLVIPADAVVWWERQIDTDYADLSEREKQSDREQVMRYLPMLVEFVADWFGQVSQHHWVSTGGLAELWREEMSGVLAGPETEPTQVRTDDGSGGGGALPGR